MPLPSIAILGLSSLVLPIKVPPAHNFPSVLPKIPPLHIITPLL